MRGGCNRQSRCDPARAACIERKEQYHRAGGERFRPADSSASRDLCVCVRVCLCMPVSSNTSVNVHGSIQPMRFAGSSGEIFLTSVEQTKKQEPQICLADRLGNSGVDTRGQDQPNCCSQLCTGGGDVN